MKKLINSLISLSIFAVPLVVFATPEKEQIAIWQEELKNGNSSTNMRLSVIIFGGAIALITVAILLIIRAIKKK